MTIDLGLGACVVDGGVRFRVWAPRARDIAVKIGERSVPLVRGELDVFSVTVPGITAGADYLYVLDGERPRPDPVSRSQPYGVHGASRVVDPTTFEWTDHAWGGVALADYVIYELHVGTFTPAGTFASAIPRLAHLASLGVTAVELMPVGEFPGGRNWGYDGVHMFAPQSTYGGPDGLRALVDACHAVGLAVIVDVVYNHVGPEGNYLEDYAPYFTDRYSTPWGRAINYDGADSDGVRRHVVTNAVSWLSEYHVDALRLDAIHGIFDGSPRHILEELCTTARATSHRQRVHVIAESDLNDVRVIEPAANAGYGFDAQWSDDLHHALRSVITGDRRGYFADFGTTSQVGRAITASFVFDGCYSAHRRRRHGSPATSQPGEKFVVCLQNHDQIANGSQGRRLSTLVDRRTCAAATTLLLAAPNLPMLFMGEEFAERAPFLYFVSHGDPALVEAVREGRRKELADLADLGALVDPQAEATFAACKLDWSLLDKPGHAEVLALYRDLLALRRREPCLGNGRKDLVRVWTSDRDRWIVVQRGDSSGQHAIILANLDERERVLSGGAATGRFQLAFASDSPRYGGGIEPGPSSFELAGGAVELPVPARAARIYLGMVS